jgi:hypothetical protein
LLEESANTPADDTTSLSNKSQSTILNLSKKIKRSPKKSYYTPKKVSTAHIKGTPQNVIKNYMKAIASFALSDLALPYLVPLLDASSVNQNEFANFICTYKDQVESLPGILALVNDDEEMDSFLKECKNIFKEMCVIFLRYYATNWIYNSQKLKHKEILLKNRLLLQRRI